MVAGLSPSRSVCDFASVLLAKTLRVAISELWHRSINPPSCACARARHRQAYGAL